MQKNIENETKKYIIELLEMESYKMRYTFKLSISKIKDYLFNIINEIWWQRKKELNLSFNNKYEFDIAIEEFFQICCNKNNTYYKNINYFDYEIKDVYECINYINKKNNEIYNSDIPIYYVLREHNIKKAILYYVGLEWKNKKLYTNETDINKRDTNETDIEMSDTNEPDTEMSDTNETDINEMSYTNERDTNKTDTNETDINERDTNERDTNKTDIEMSYTNEKSK